MSRTEHLSTGKFYHIFNRGIDGCNLFKEPDNYKYFIRLYEKYIDPIADTYCWVLMKNHFHFLVRIKDLSDLPGFKKLEGLKAKPPHQYFSNLFNAYTKAFNKKYKRTGSLFEKNFHRKQINNTRYLKNVIVYIHQNPLHHSFCDRISDYPWSSYQVCISMRHTKLKREAVIGWFDNQANFQYYNEQKIETRKIEEWLEI